MSHYEIEQRGTGRQAWRLLIDGQPQRYPDGRVHVYSEQGARDALHTLETAERDAEREARAEAVRQQAQSVLSTARKPRMDGVSWEDHEARYGPPPSLQAIHQDAKQLVLAQGGSYATYALQGGTATGVSIRRGEDVIYTGTVDGLAAHATRSRHAIALHPWKHITVDVLRGYLGRARGGVGTGEPLT